MAFIDSPDDLDRLHNSTVDNSDPKRLRLTRSSVVVRCFAASRSAKDTRSPCARCRRKSRAAPDAQGRGYSSDGGLLHVTHSRKVRQAAPFRHRRNGAGPRSARGVAIKVEHRLVWMIVRVPFIIDTPREQSCSGVNGRSCLAPMGWQQTVTVLSARHYSATARLVHHGADQRCSLSDSPSVRMASRSSQLTERHARFFPSSLHSPHPLLG